MKKRTIAAIALVGSAPLALLAVAPAQAATSHGCPSNNFCVYQSQSAYNSGTPSATFTEATPHSSFVVQTAHAGSYGYDNSSEVVSVGGHIQAGPVCTYVAEVTWTPGEATPLNAGYNEVKSASTVAGADSLTC